MARNKPTMQDIADTLGISKNSVYLALNDKPGVSESLKKRILETADSMGYGGFLSGAKSRCIMVVTPEYLRNDAFFYSEVFWAVEREAKKRGYLSISASISPESEAQLQLPALPEGVEVTGFLLVGILQRAYVKKLSGMQIPMICVDIPYPGLPMTCIASANHSGGYTAAKHLIDKGHSRIGFIGPIHTAQSVYERWCGFQQAMEQASLPVDGSFNITGQPGQFELFDTADVLEPRFAGINRYPTAWFCAGDRIAITVINLLTVRGVRVPEDVSVIGFDDIPLAQIVMPQLTTMHVDRSRMGRLAVEYLIQTAERKRAPLSVCLPCYLVERGTVAVPRGSSGLPQSPVSEKERILL